MAQLETKFTVINNKHAIKYLTDGEQKKLNKILRSLTLRMENDGKKDNYYYVCNSDEPYAQQILDIILTEESKKEI